MTYRIMIRNRIRVIISSCLSSPKSLPIRISKRHRAQQCYRFITALITGVAVVICYYILFIYTRRISARELGLDDVSDPYWTSDECRSSAECRAHARVQYLHGLLELDRFQIPHIIHQSAYSADSVPVKISYRGQESLLAEWMHSWPDRNPTWRYLFWSWPDVQRAINVALPQYDDVIRRVSDHLMRLDIGRYVALYLVGGVFIDLDVESIAAIPDQITLDNEAFLVSQPALVSEILHHQSSRPDDVIMGSRPGHPFWLRLLDAIAERVEQDACTNRDKCTGPHLVADIFNEYNLQNAPVTVLAADLLYMTIPESERIQINRVCKNDEVHELKEECRDFFSQPPVRTGIASTAIGIRHEIPEGGRVVLVADIVDVIPPARLERPFDNPTQWSWWHQT